MIDLPAGFRQACEMVGFVPLLPFLWVILFSHSIGVICCPVGPGELSPNGKVFSYQCKTYDCKDYFQISS